MHECHHNNRTFLIFCKLMRQSAVLLFSLGETFNVVLNGEGDVLLQ